MSLLVTPDLGAHSLVSGACTVRSERTCAVEGGSAVDELDVAVSGSQVLAGGGVCMMLSQRSAARLLLQHGSVGLEGVSVAEP
jgi:hypothetical protein